MRSKVYFKSCDVKISGILNVPKKQNNKKFIMIFCHGWAGSSKSGKIITLVPKLSKKGISSFAFDFYGHGESEGKLENITQTIAVQNVRDAISFLKLKGFAKFGLYGDSFGGGTATAFSAKEKEPNLPFLCLVSTVTKYKRFWQNKEEKRLNLKNNFAKRFLKDLKKYDYFSLAGKIKIPTLIVQGEKDASTPPAGARKFLKNLSGEKMMVTIKGAGHRFLGKKRRKDMISAVYNFILYNLPKH